MKSDSLITIFYDFERWWCIITLAHFACTFYTLAFSFFSLTWKYTYISFQTSRTFLHKWTKNFFFLLYWSIILCRILYHDRFFFSFDQLDHGHAIFLSTMNDVKCREETRFAKNKLLAKSLFLFILTLNKCHKKEQTF